MWFHLTGRRGRGVLAGALILALPLTACSSAASNSGSSTVRFGVFNWDAARVTTQILIQITKKYPKLGVEDTKVKNLGTQTGWVGLGRGDVDVLTEVAWPNQKPLYKKYKDKTNLLSKTYSDAPQGWFVPSYMVKQGGQAPNLSRVTQLDQYKQLFSGKLYDGPPGWITSQWNGKRLKAYGLDYKHVTVGESALLAELKGNYREKQPMLLYLWHPHWVFAEYDLTQLKEARPYQKGCLEKASVGPCAMPDYAAYVAAHKDLREKAPKFYAFLERFRVKVPVLEEMLAKVRTEKTPIPQVAKQWVQSHQSKVQSWVKKAQSASSKS